VWSLEPAGVSEVSLALHPDGRIETQKGLSSVRLSCGSPQSERRAISNAELWFTTEREESDQ
jgi:hypothetical protein